MQEYLNVLKKYIKKVKRTLIKLRDHWYDDYGITLAFRRKFAKSFNKFMHNVSIVLGVVSIFVLVGLLTAGLIAIILVMPYFAIIYILFCVLSLFYILVRDYLDEKYQIL